MYANAANTLAASARRGRVLVVSLIVLLCLVSVGFMGLGVIAQEDRWRAMDPPVLTVEQGKAQAAKPGSDFKECAKGCPVMIVIPAGKFIMGSPENEPERDDFGATRPRQMNLGRSQPHTLEADTHDEQVGVPWREWHIQSCQRSSSCPLT